jgi:hypothetical protein
MEKGKRKRIKLGIADRILYISGETTLAKVKSKEIRRSKVMKEFKELDPMDKMGIALRSGIVY